MTFLIVFGIFVVLALLPRPVSSGIGQVLTFLLCVFLLLGLVWTVLPIVIRMLQWVHELLSKMFGEWPPQRGPE